MIAKLFPQMTRCPNYLHNVVYHYLSRRTIYNSVSTDDLPKHRVQRLRKICIKSHQVDLNCKSDDIPSSYFTSPL
jgi:hypothetical protein